jgi:hypothetical protein
MFPCPKGKERHHIDGNPLNNSPENILLVTRKEHMMADGRKKFATKEERGKSYRERNRDRINLQHHESYCRYREKAGIKRKQYRLINIEKIRAHDRDRDQIRTPVRAMGLQVVLQAVGLPHMPHKYAKGMGLA